MTENAKWLQKHLSEIRTPDWLKVEQMVGLPDYGMAFCVSPWPDGGWMAGLALVDVEWVTEQVEDGYIVPGVLNLTDHRENHPDWDTFDGFKDGLNAHGSDAKEAIDRLWKMLHGESDPKWEYELERESSD